MVGMAPLTLFQLTAMALLVMGLFGLIWRRTLVGMLICVELMLNGAGLALAAAGQYAEGTSAFGQIATLMVMGLAAAEATLVLAILFLVSKRFGGVDADAVSTLKG